MKLNRLSAAALTAALLSSSCTVHAAERTTDIVLSDNGIKVAGTDISTDPTAAVYAGAEIIYYHAGGGETYGEGTAQEEHTEEEANAHTVVTITQPGTYRLTGSLSKGQIAVDLGKEAKDDPNAVVTLILDDVDVTCSVAPALIFYNVYECDREFISYDNDENPDYTSTAKVDTSAAGANIILAAGSENTFTGSHVARIYKEGTTKKLHKYDGAFYSKMSMNIHGDGTDNSGVLNIVADNEGLDSELHLTINGGMINITSQDDGINTNEDLVSVTTVNGGTLRISAGNGSEGDGIDSNGYLVINGGTVWTTANPNTGDGGIDADSPILLNGGVLSAFGSRNDAADSKSEQVYMELSFASSLPAGSKIALKDTDGNAVWTAQTDRACQSVTITTPDFNLDTTYSLYVDDILQCWNGNSFGMGHPGGIRPDGFQRPDGEVHDDGQRPERPGGFRPDMPDMADNGERPQPPEGFDPGQFGHGQRPDGMGESQADGSGSTEFVLTSETRSFSGVCDSDASGKTRVSFTIDGAERDGGTVNLTSVTGITASVELDPALVQITVTDNPSENYSKSCRLSDGLEAVNALLPQEDGAYLFTAAVVSGTEQYTGATQIPFSVGQLPFSDVRENSDGYEAIRTVWKAGAMNGTGNGRFSPNLTVTRAQAVTALARMSGAETQDSEDFLDVAPDAWYSGYVAWAVENGIVEGDGTGHFLPDEAVTAEQVALMLGRLQSDYVNHTNFSGELTRSQLAQMLADSV